MHKLQTEKWSYPIKVLYLRSLSHHCMFFHKKEGCSLRNCRIKANGLFSQYNNFRKMNQNNNIELAKIITKMLQNEEKVNTVAKYGKIEYQFTRTDLNQFKSKSKLQYMTRFINKRIRQDKNQAQNKNIQQQKTQIVWHDKEYKAFVWISVWLSYLKQNQAASYNILFQDNYCFIDWLFIKKTSTFLEYYSRSLIKQYKIDKGRWEKEELQQLYSILSRPDYNMKWTKASIALFIQSKNKYYRSPQRCREIWSHRLNPSVTHSRWTVNEDEILLMYVYRHGKKWAQISRALKNTRNQHMVKNRFNSLMVKYKSAIDGRSFDKSLQILLKIIRGDKSYQQTQSITPQVNSQVSSSNKESNLLQTSPIQLQKSPPVQEVLIEVQSLEKYWYKRLIFVHQDSLQGYQYQQNEMRFPYSSKRLVLFEQPLGNIFGCSRQ